MSVGNARTIVRYPEYDLLGAGLVRHHIQTAVDGSVSGGVSPVGQQIMQSKSHLHGIDNRRNLPVADIQIDGRRV